MATLTIRNKTEVEREVSGVEDVPAARNYVRTVNEVQEVYPYLWWEPADIEEWGPVRVSVSADQRSLSDNLTHVAGILNRGYRFAITNNVLSVEKLG